MLVSNFVVGEGAYSGVDAKSKKYRSYLIISSTLAYSGSLSNHNNDGAVGIPWDSHQTFTADLSELVNFLHQAQEPTHASHSQVKTE